VALIDTSEEILARLAEMEATIGINNQHIRDMVKQVQFLDHIITQLLERTDRIERKTAALSDRPGSRNCPHCTKVVHNAGSNCSHCGGNLFE
jgi:hypothetical protein